MADDEELRRKHQALEERVGEIRRQFVASLPRRIHDLQGCWQSCKASNHGEAELEALLRAAHTLKGAAGTFGQQTISAAAGAIGDIVRLGLERGTALSEEEQCRIDREVARLGRLARQTQQSL